MGKVKAIFAKKLKRSLQIKSVGRIKKWKNMSVLGVCKSGALIEKKNVLFDFIYKLLLF